MFDIKEYAKRRNANLEFENALERLENTKKFLNELKYKYDETCTHDLILHLGKEGYCTTDTGYAECLCCGKVFRLKEYCDAEIPNEKIINIVGLVPEDYFYTVNNKGNILVARAKEKLDELASNGEEFPADVLEQIIISDLCQYTENKKQEREEFLARSRKKDNK